ncbi:MAG: HAD hydrolase family protein, partial [Pseudomonadales bacterium]|nr:HAD hydrolase family protein [Pseudomonadales bacterium]
MVFTDLDGSLLDHHSYSYDAALPALTLLEQKNIPIIFCSSKTRAEMDRLRIDMGHAAPFIIENGAAICGLTHRNGAFLGWDGSETIALGKP